MSILAGILAFIGAGCGSAFAFWAARGATRAEREARRREEWGRRFSIALDRITSADPISRATGRALLEELLGSALATDDDRQAAQAVLDAAATHSARGALVLPSDDLDEVDVVRDTGSSDPAEGGAHE